MCLHRNYFSNVSFQGQERFKRLRADELDKAIILPTYDVIPTDMIQSFVIHTALEIKANAEFAITKVSPDIQYFVQR